MLLVKKTMLLLLVSLTVSAANAQQTNTPTVAVFSRFSNLIDLSEATLANAMQMSKGQTVTLQLGENFNFPGTVISNENVYSNLQTVIIKSSDYNNALLQVSKQINEDKSISYVGRIFSQGSSDGFEMKRNTNGSYRLQKFETVKILQDCDLH